MSYIYLIECYRADSDSTTYKIGHAKNVEKRIKELTTGNDGNLSIIHQYKSEFSTKIESALHNHYKHKKIKNEWFLLEKQDIDNFIEKCKKIEFMFKNKI